MALSVTAAFWNYDRTGAIVDGRVRIDGCDVTCTIIAPHVLFPRAFGAAEFDISELSLSRQAQAVAAGTSRYLAVPIFLSRAFRHASIYIRRDRGIREPSDLQGRRIGLVNYDDTAAVVVRGMLREEYGLDTRAITWVCGDLASPVRTTIVPPLLHADAQIDTLAPGETLDRELAAGGLDGVIALNPPPCFRAHHPHVQRLFPQWRTAEEDYFRRTGLFPIMHVLGIRSSLVEREPWLRDNVIRAFEGAKAMALDDLSNLQACKSTLPWLVDAYHATTEIMGEDYWPYGTGPNELVLERTLQYLAHDGLLRRPLRPAELFEVEPGVGGHWPQEGSKGCC